MRLFRMCWSSFIEDSNFAVLTEAKLLSQEMLQQHTSLHNVIQL